MRPRVTAGLIAAAVEAPGGSILLLRTTIAGFKSETGVTPIRFAKPAYPFDSQTRSEGAKVDVRYVVGDDSRVNRGSVEVLFVTVETRRAPIKVAEGFAVAAIDTITTSKFQPAKVGGCSVVAVVNGSPSTLGLEPRNSEPFHQPFRAGVGNWSTP